MHSHHSHSGEYVSHAVDSLESVVGKAESMGFTHFCLTEHMPRLQDKFLYPEEIDKQYTVANLQDNFNKYLKHAQKVQAEYKSRQSATKILIGFEVEGLNTEHINYTKDIVAQHASFINMTIGSVHYVNEIPIDFSPELWLAAMNSTPEKTARSLFAHYFELQYEVILELKPLVIGHFDLIRLFQPSQEVDSTTGKFVHDIDIETDWPDVWELVVRNIKLVQLYGGLFELNSAAIRKGWTTPYPQGDICRAIIKFGDGKFCLSDDCHSIAQVGLNYHKVWKFIRDDLKLDSIYHLDLTSLGETIVAKKSVSELNNSKFWEQYN